MVLSHNRRAPYKHAAQPAGANYNRGCARLTRPRKLSWCQGGRLVR